jgi:hypothetical protein
VVEGMLRLLQRQRAHELIDTDLLRTMVQMLRELTLYNAVFSEPFLKAARQHYHEEGLRLSGELLPWEYLSHCETRLAEERATCENLLEASTLEPLQVVVKDELVANHFAELMEAGPGRMLEEQREVDLARLFRLARTFIPIHRHREIHSHTVALLGIELLGARIVGEESKEV